MTKSINNSSLERASESKTMDWFLPFHAYSRNALRGNGRSVTSTWQTIIFFSPSFPLFLLSLLPFITSLLPCFTCHSFLIPFFFLFLLSTYSNIPVSCSVTGHYMCIFVWKTHVFDVYIITC